MYIFVSKDNLYRKITLKNKVLLVKYQTINQQWYKIDVESTIVVKLPTWLTVKVPL